MKTAVLVDSSFVGSSQKSIPLVLEPAPKARGMVTREARTGRSGLGPKRRCVVVPFSGSTPRLEVADGRICVPKFLIWELLELGCLMMLLCSAFALIYQSLVAAGNL
jgi:hypothetical protein